ncbi:transcription elongation factor, mitochondrial isoform X2 [Microcaecilia unicolor]|uniref:Transcription elongation factor, mitochondrial n=1 Tax=Microcaecilia unicolor TaxID=1415580 RepID=A0A6P7YMH9_9AMPH|nr:transcription elongation factor, mitochondrial isoform X2 [Microcaecilia unicolor]
MLQLWPLLVRFRAGTILLQGNQELYSTLRCRTLHCSCSWGKALAPAEDGFINSLSSEERSKEPESQIDDQYTTEQRSAILQMLNTASEKELLKLMRGKKSVSIVDYRTKHGPFQDLQSLMKVPQFKYKTTVKLCDLILSPPASEQGERKIQGSRLVVKFMGPEIKQEKLQSAESIVSIVFGTQTMAWAHVTRNLSVLDWQREECYSFMKGPYVASAYLEDILAVVSKIPEADFYILEKSGISVQHVNLFPVMLHLRTVEAMLFALLDGTFMKDGQHRVLTMARNAVGKHFDLMVGAARTSGLDLIKQLLLDAVTKSQPRVSFPQDVLLQHRNRFQAGSRKREEEMCDALLQAIAFYDLVG